ncbi:GntR family transcriptional regulator [Sedimentibacter hydroxybenzoicus DSM 7310]|uniref:GntR family transcriptional regulator n=1 Tax=Sedimentibacter hydroxybenzoicus DSM 7310 TaxID=1123245 RepID=A0A974BGF9_SEDHY|nr:GntR family transcriptional regulator [Sedimentibacter hydroxybenzoicus]NYB72645.1 GntR family transcriptional regulator [Sedimentibacter hydroxybenzoicus DSM 7310]
MLTHYMSLKDHVYNYISEKINDGSLKPDDKINEQQISDALNISRTPIREALIQLASDGFLENTPRRGFRVKFLDIKRAQELYEIIGILDGRIAYNTVDLIKEDDLRNMKFLADSMDVAIEQGMSAKYYELQIQFHDIYLNLYDNSELISLLNKLKDNFLRKYYIFDDKDNEMQILRKTNLQHHEIIQLFKEKKKDELERYIRDVHWNKESAMFDSL